MANGGANRPALSLPDLVASTNDAGGTARNVITALLGTAIVLAATILASTDEAILRNSLDAPFGISASIKLSIAYALMPPVFLFLHATALLQLQVLAVRINAFTTLLTELKLPAKDGDAWKRQLSDFAYVQYYVDEDVAKTSVETLLEYARNGLLWVVIQVSVAWVPLLILLGAQISFLRYQSETITGLHMVSVLLDVGLILWFKITQTKLLNAPTERPGAWMLIAALIFLNFWLLGWPIKYAVAIVTGLLIGWLYVTTARLLKMNQDARRLWRNHLAFYVIFLAVALKIIFDIDAYWFAILMVGVTGTFLILSMQDWIHRKWTSKTNAKKRWVKWLSAEWRQTNVQTIKAVIAPFVFALPIVLLSLTQATIPSDSELACQVRWRADIVDQKIEQLKRDTGISDAQIPGSVRRDIRMIKYVRLIAGPVLGVAGPSPCLPGASSGKLATTEQDFRGDPATAIRFANIFDRWLCPAWQVGCRFIALPSRVLSTNSDITAALAAIKESDTQEGIDKITVSIRAEGLPLRGRNLRFTRMEQAVLAGADMRGVDARGSDLSSANLSFALISNALLDRAQLNNAKLNFADLYNSDINDASLTGVSLKRAYLASAKLRWSQLDAANLTSAIVDNADLTRASLRGATLDSASLRGTNLFAALLHGASLKDTKLQGARLDDAKMQLATLDGAQLQGASLDHTWLHGASFVDTRLQGALMNIAQMKGVTFSYRPAPGNDVSAIGGGIIIGGSRHLGSLEGSFGALDNFYCGQTLLIDMATGPWPAQDGYLDAMLEYMQSKNFTVDAIKAVRGRIPDATAPLLTCANAHEKDQARQPKPTDWSEIVADSACADVVAMRGVMRNLETLSKSSDRFANYATALTSEIDNNRTCTPTKIALRPQQIDLNNKIRKWAH